MDSGIPRFCTINTPAITISNRRRFHMRCIRTMVWLSNTESKTSLSFKHFRYPLRLLLRRTIVKHQQQSNTVANNRMLVL